MYIPHVVMSQQFDRPFLERLYQTTTEMKERLRQGDLHLACKMKYKTLVSLFYEPSTRTRLSFEIAGANLGAHIITTDNANVFSSAIKGESLEDSIRVISTYLSASSYRSVIVLRHNDKGAALRAAEVSCTPIINAGDGTGQHPTQTLLDLYTIYDECGGVDGLTIALVGDLRYGRTIHSLAYLLAKFAIKQLYLVSPEELKLPRDVRDYLIRHNTPFEENANLDEVAPLVDVIYQTRLQKERFPKEELFDHVSGRYIIDRALIERMKTQARILHPLPRNNEIAQEIDNDPRAAYFRQAQNGLFVRMALLDIVCNTPCDIPPLPKE